MSKRSKGQSMMYQPAGSKKNIPARAKDRAGIRKAGTGKGGARAYERPARTSSVNPDRVLRMRISSAVIALLALGGAIYWSWNANGSYTPQLIVGVVLLAFIAGLMIFSAVRPEIVLKRAGQFNRRR